MRAVQIEITNIKHFSPSHDNGNATLYGLPDSQYHRLQRMLNIAARILTLTPSFHHITPIMKSLHWLPVEKRIIYKITLLTFKALHGLAPKYISELIKPYPTPRELRSADANLLDIPPTRTKTYGDRAFCHAAPVLWNKLPDDLRKINKLDSFKQHLKTLLFKSTYEC